MFRTIALAGATAAAIVGVGTAAIAASGPSATPGAGSAAKTGQTQQQGKHANGKHAGKHNGQKLRAALRHSVHGSVVTKNKDGYVVHTSVRGTVTAVSATSVTVKAADGYTKTFVIDKTTKIREKATAKGKKPTAGTVSDLKTGDQVGVLGKGADKAGAASTAMTVLDGLKK